MTTSLTRRRLAALIAVAAVVSTFLAVAFVHDNPTGLTPIADINSGAVAPGENVTIKCEAVPYTGVVTMFVPLNLSDGRNYVIARWYESNLKEGWLIIARCTVESNETLGDLIWFERVWLFV